MVTGLHHPSIVQYHGWFFHERSLWLVMEYCDASLSDVISVLGSLTEPQISAVAQSCLSSLYYVHRLNRIHRDIKSGNLLVTSDGLVKVCDFGIAAQLDVSSAQRASRIGSPYWMAPEVITATGYDTKADIWSFGITLLELFCGAPPRRGLLEIQCGPPPRAPDRASPEFAAFIERVLVKDPTLRPTADALLDDRDQFLKIAGGRAAEIVSQMWNEYRSRVGRVESPAIVPPSAIEEEEFGDGTVILRSDVTKEEDTLEGWSMKFLEKSGVVGAKKRNFSNFSERDLRYLIESIRQLAITEIAAGKDSAVVRAHYDDVRSGIVEELRRRDESVPTDFGAID
jgi:serine/threonine protein kinase